MATFPTQLFIESTGKVKTTLTGGSFFSTTNRIGLKRGDNAKFQIKFLTPGTNTPFKLTAGSTVQVAMKEAGKYASTTGYCAFGSTSTTPTADTDPYEVLVVLDSNALDALFVNGDTENAYVDVMFEVSWTEDSGATWNSTSEPIVARIYNEVIRPEVTTAWNA